MPSGFMQIDRSTTEERCEVPDCNDADFLPSRCNKCRMLCCSAHASYAAHNCTQFHDSIRHRCPICNLAIAIPHGQSADRFVSAHIDSGCKIHIEAGQQRQNASPAGMPSPPTSLSPLPAAAGAAVSGHSARLNFCSHSDCSRNEDVLITCPHCRQSYCIGHRSPLDHACKRLTPPPASTPVIADPSKPLTKRSQPTQLHKRKFTNTIATALYKEKIVEGVSVAVFVGDTNPFWITFQRRNPIGLALDKLCKAANVPNTNNSAASDADKWFVFCLTSGKSIAMDMALDPNMLVEDVAVDGDVWFVGKGPSLPETVANEVASQTLQCTAGRSAQTRGVSKSEGSGCAVA